MKEKNGKLPEDEKRRRRALAAAALLGLAGILYLSGLLAQLRTGYRSWMAEGGMAGQSLMPPACAATCWIWWSP